MIVSIIAAVAKDRTIGKDNDLIWHYPKDMAFFKSSTKNHYVIMGRRNYDSIPKKYRPLPHRTNVIVTRQTDLVAEGCLIVNSLEEAIEIAKNDRQDEVFIIGGGQIYTQALNDGLVNKMYLTHIDKDYHGDAFFPEFDLNNWTVSNEEHHDKDDKHEANFVIKTYQKLI